MPPAQWTASIYRSWWTTIEGSAWASRMLCAPRLAACCLRLGWPRASLWPASMQDGFAMIGLLSGQIEAFFSNTGVINLKEEERENDHGGGSWRGRGFFLQRTSGFAISKSPSLSLPSGVFWHRLIWWWTGPSHNQLKTQKILSISWISLLIIKSD